MILKLIYHWLKGDLLRHVLSYCKEEKPVIMKPPQEPEPKPAKYLLSSELIGVKKGKKKYKLLILETKEGIKRFNLGRHFETVSHEIL
jgi:hypothetical protein